MSGSTAIDCVGGRPDRWACVHQSSVAATASTAVAPAEAAAAMRSARGFGDSAPASAASRSSRTNAAALCGRSAGAFASAWSIMRATGSGTAGRSAVTGLGFTLRCWYATLSAVAPVNGGWPASISYSTQPKP